MNIYLGAPWAKKTEAAVAARQMEAAGLTLLSTWHDLPDLPEYTDEYLQDEAFRDINELRRADVLVLLNLEKSEGKATEWGIAIACGIPRVLVGPLDGNVFYRLPDTIHVNNVQDAIDLIRNW